MNIIIIKNFSLSRDNHLDSNFSVRVDAPAITLPFGVYGAGNINDPVGAHVATEWSSPAVPESGNSSIDPHFVMNGCFPIVTSLGNGPTENHLGSAYDNVVHSLAKNPYTTVNSGDGIYSSPLQLNH